MTGNRTAATLSLSAVLRTAAVVGFATFAAGSLRAGTTPAPASQPAGDTSQVVATVDGAPITRQDIESDILREVLQSQPDLLDNALARRIDTKLLELESAKLKLTTDQLIEKEVKAKLPAITDADVDKLYDEKKDQIRQPKEQVAAQIRQYLERQHGQEVYLAYMTKLRSQYAVKNLMAEQREAAENQQATARRPKIEAGDAPSLGPANAPVTLVEFSDFQCPYCARLVPDIEKVRKTYGDRVRVVFRPFPLVSIHPQAQKAAEAALCAAEQGKFWDLHDAMFKAQDKLDVPSLKEKAKAIAGLDTKAFNACVDANKMAEKVNASVALGHEVGVADSTPTVYVNGYSVQLTNPPYEPIAAALDAQLAKVTKK